MKLKKLLALLLALAMVFSLAACAGKDNDDDDDDDEKTEQSSKKDDEDDEKDYEAPLRAVVDFVKDPTLEKCMLLAGGDFVGEELTEFMNLFAMLNDGDLSGIEDEMLSEMGLEGVESLKYTVKDKTAFTDEELEEYRQKLSDMADSFEEYASMGDMLAEMTDADWEGVAESLNMSVDQTKDFMNRFVAVCTNLHEKLSTADLSEAYALEVESDMDGETQDETINVFCINGDWISDALFEMGL